MKISDFMHIVLKSSFLSLFGFRVDFYIYGRVTVNAHGSDK
jgi:hypothetical protein